MSWVGVIEVGTVKLALLCYPTVCGRGWKAVPNSLIHISKMHRWGGDHKTILLFMSFHKFSQLRNSLDRKSQKKLKNSTNSPQIFSPPSCGFSIVIVSIGCIFPTPNHSKNRIHPILGALNTSFHTHAQKDPPKINALCDSTNVVNFFSAEVSLCG